MMQTNAVFRHSRWDAVLVFASLAHGTALLLWPSILVIALGLWWCANTVSHNFIHLPFFRSHGVNAGFSVYLSLLLGLPQTVWQQRHLSHHADRPCRLRFSPLLATELACVGALWTGMLIVAPWFFLTIYLPGWLIGLALCQLQGHYEHARGTTSHYGRVYNFLFFNDGFHSEHHNKPARHWRELPRQAEPDAHASRWPAVLRWIECFSLESLERGVLRVPMLQRIVVATHERAFRKLLSRMPVPQRIAIVGGALFPRTAIVLQRIVPQARIVIIDSNHDHILQAKRFLNGSAEYEHRLFESAVPADDFDLVVIPLCFRGERESLYHAPPARALLIHDWLWHRRGCASAIVARWLLKRVNLVVR